ncbi:hypothetical protein JCM16358_26100 [Halanaerocella petrolearia]
MKNKYIIVTLILLILLSSPVLARVKVGGKVDTSIITSLNDKDSQNFLQNKLNLNLMLPVSGNTEAKFEVDLFNGIKNNKLNSQLKKLYIANHFSKFDLTVGRQPISWSFGSLLNPVDFNLGAEAMNEESNNKSIDALEVYYPINWNSSITGIAAFPNNNAGDIKVGFRGRTYYQGYDLSFNYVADKDVNNNRQRIGITGKGDLGPIGAYGAVGYYFDFQEAAFLAGIDYSFLLNDINRLTLQGEYLRYEADVLQGMLASIGSNLNLGKDLVTVMITYELDDFSSISSYVIVDSQQELILGGEYKSQLNSNLDFRLQGSYSNDSDSGMIETTVSYPF